MTDKDPFYEVYRRQFVSSKPYAVTLLKQYVRDAPPLVRAMVTELADFWLQNNRNEARKMETLERRSRAFHAMKMYRDFGFNVADSEQLAIRETDYAGDLRLAWDRDQFARTWKALPPLVPPLTKKERNTLWDEVMRQ